MKSSSTLLLLTFFVSIKFHVVDLLYNAALYKPAWQSSTYGDRIANRGNDGNRLMYVNGSFRGTETLSDDPAWWMVDLKGQYVIEQIVFSNRYDSLQNAYRLHDFQIDTFSTDPRNLKNFVNVSGDVCFNRTDPVGMGTFTWNCKTPVTGRYLRLIRYTKGFFNVMELEVMVSQELLTSMSFSRQKDLILNISPVVSVNVSSSMQCVQRCMKLRSGNRCTSFNWVTSNNTCQLLSIDTRIKNTILSRLTPFVGIHFYM